MARHEVDPFIFVCDPLMKPPSRYSWRRGQRKTRWTVRLSEIVSSVLITSGGIITIVAVALVFFFLAAKVVPLFLDAEVTGEFSKPQVQPDQPPRYLVMDEEQLMSWMLLPDGTLRVSQLTTGAQLEAKKLFNGETMTASSEAIYHDVREAGTSAVRYLEIAFGFDDGSVKLGRFRFRPTFFDEEDVTADVRSLPAGVGKPFQRGIISRTPGGQYCLSELEAEIKPAKSETDSPVLLIDQSFPGTGSSVCTLHANGELRLNTVIKKENLLTLETNYELTGEVVSYPSTPGRPRPDHLFLSAEGKQIFLLWKDGYLLRLDVRDPAKPKVAETKDILPEADAEVTIVRHMIGKGTFLVGDSLGTIRAWFLAYSDHANTSDGLALFNAHTFPGDGSAVTALTTSSRSRMAAAGFADGSIKLLYVTNDNVMLRLPATGSPVQALALAPKENGLLAYDAKEVRYWEIDPQHPAVTPAALFAKIWYEGYDRPEHVWQSSSGTDAFEPKFGVVPLVFGTIKATFYSLLFGVPLALLAAIYTSEYLRPSTKAVIKPTIELMASLPSVVLGFLAGLVIAPFAEQVLPALLAGFLTIPLSFLLAANIWQLLPDRISLALSHWRFLFGFLVLPIGIALAVVTGPVLEELLFAGNLRTWLDAPADAIARGEGGSALGGWMLLFLPLSAIPVALLFGRVLNRWIRHHTLHWSHFACAVADLLRFLTACAMTVALALAVSWLLQTCGLDPRTLGNFSFVGPFSQRNALVVGFIMGFAIIPIIYTVAEDALSAVPEHLRAGSLAAGATRWQTAVRIIIPTAMSGIFSAIMIGTGRAVGETMIVLMATGNTPVMEWNIFSGFRTLAANIAVEMPEAVKDSTHFRTLVLAALILFLMTFVLNTIAEIIRLRFRERAYQL
ncbi:MAG: hypothetical protein KatS3mg105_1664 [Gemmatales bacterium]|nr:MAG: hypothetical protein KatS3mg105_1664 [Gemmatales bacterium]